MKALVVLVLIAAWQTCLASAQTSTCSVSITGTSAGGVQAASIACTGAPVRMTGAAVLQPFSAEFSTGVNFSVDSAADSLLSISGQQVNFETLVLANLTLQQYSVLNVSEGTYNFTNSNINGNAVSANAFVIVAISSTVNVISSTFISNTGGNFGGGLSLAGGNLNVQDSMFLRNAALISGGAVAVNGSTSTSFTITDSQFTGNTAGCKGGHVYVSTFNAGTISNCTFDQGSQTIVSGAGAGGICASEARYTTAGSSACYLEQYTTASVTASTFIANSQVGAGGVLGIFTGLTTSVTGCNFTANSSPNGIGSALFAVVLQTLSVANNTFTDNGASLYGALYATVVSSVLVQNNTFTANQVAPAAAGGGGASSGGAVCLVNSCTQLCDVLQNVFTGNSVLGAGADGGGIYADTPGNLTITDNEFVSNTAVSAGGAILVYSNGQTTSPTALFLDGNTFTNNTATDPQSAVGGAVSMNNIITVNMTGNTFVANTAALQGGAMFAVGTTTSTLGLQSSRFVNNTAVHDGGGAMYLYTLQDVMLSNVTFMGNSAGNQGGALETNIVPTISVADSVFDGNTAQTSGGGWSHAAGTTVILQNAVFSNNIASINSGGGALLNTWGTATITNVSFTGNQAQGTAGTAGATSSAPQAGGIGFVSGIAASFVACRFTSNSAAANGGSVYAFGVGSSLEIQQSTFTDSQAGLAGGAIRVSGSSNVSMTACTVELSSAKGIGGAMSAYNMTGVMTFSGDTFSNNTAGTQGGILAVTDSPGFSVTISNSTVSDNTAPQGSTVYADSGSSITSTVAAIDTSTVACDYCLFQGPGATSSTNLTSSGGRALTPGTSSGSSGSGGSSLSGGAIAGISVGALAGVALIVVLAWLVFRRGKTAAVKKDVEMAKPEKPQVTTAKNRLPPVKSAFSEAGTGSFWSQQRETNGHSDRSSNLENLNSDDMIAGHSITGSVGASTVNSRKPLLDTNTGVTYISDTMSHMTDNTNTPFPDVPWSDWQIDARDIQIVQRPNGKDWLLGGGAFGQVYKAMLKGVIPVAVKVLKDQSYTSREEFQREVGLLKSLHNSNIVQFQGACLEEDKMLLITEFMDGGDLHKALSRRQIAWDKRGKNVAIDILRGLHFLHAKRIVHMDLKSPNILLTRHGQAKLADVGLAKVIRDRNYITQVSVIGTFAWAAPEVLTNERCTEKADIYSFGIILWEIVTGEAPVRGGRRDVRVPEECPQEVASLIDSCLQTDPAARPTALEALDVLMREPDDEQAAAAAS